MNDVHKKAAANTTHSFAETADGSKPNRATIYTGDIRQPGEAVFGFPMMAARLAAGQGLLLHCREDEVVGLIEKLNELLESPENLDRAYEMLEKLQEKSRQKLVRLVTLREQPIADDEVSDLLADAEQLLTEPQEQSVAERLASILAPNHPTEEIAGTSRFVARLGKLMAALKRVRDQGFHVTVHDRRRKLMRPPLKARRNVTSKGAPRDDALVAGDSSPPKFHLTLWTYLVARGAEA